MLWTWFWYSVPWEIKAVLLGGLVVLGYVALGTVLRWPSWLTPRWLIFALAAAALAVGFNRAAQKGYRAAEQRNLDAANKMVEKARKAREKSEQATADPSRLRDDDGFRRD